jgi:hypothetical protein
VRMRFRERVFSASRGLGASSRPDKESEEITLGLRSWGRRPAIRRRFLTSSLRVTPLDSLSRLAKGLGLESGAREESSFSRRFSLIESFYFI